MALPEAIRKQGEKADELQKGLKEPAATPELKDVKKKDDVLETAKKQTVDTEQTFEKQNDVAEKTVDKQNKDTDNRYSTLQGMFDKYKTDMKDIVGGLKDELGQANRTIANLNSIIVDIQKNKAPDIEETTPEPNNKLDANNYDGYGEEIGDLVNQVNELIEENRKLRDQMSGVEVTVTETRKEQAQNVLERFEAGMDKLVPEWRDLNTDPLFLNWLDDGWQAMLDKAGDTYDAKSAARVFKAYINDTGYGKKQTYEQEDTKTQYDIKEEVTPGEGGGGGAPIKDNFKRVSPREFQKASEDRARGRITLEQFEQISRDFHKTLNEGRGR